MGNGVQNHHLEAWERVKKHIFGEVVEVSRETPWGFHMHRPLTNLSVKDFLKKKIKTDTIILHILYGEGETKATVKKVIKKSLESCVKLIVLEHSKGFDTAWMDFGGNKVIEEDWGRNKLYACTTMTPLNLPQLSDAYLENLNKTFVEPHDEGIDPKHLVYTHTSERPIDFTLPKGRIYWVIGGGLAYESMKKQENILFDSVLRQVLYCAYRYGVDEWKLKRIYPVDEIKAGENHKQWRKVKRNRVKPNSIEHFGLEDLHTEDTVYVSTCKPELWSHLKNVIEAHTTRDVCSYIQR